MKMRKRTKRSILAVFMAAVMLPMLSGMSYVPHTPVVAAAVIHDDDLVMRYDSMAGTVNRNDAWKNDESFYRALPVGNGRIGATVYGNYPEEWFDLNECTIWSSGPGNNNKSGAASKLKQVQDLIAAGNYKDANKIITDSMIGGGQAKYQKVGMLKLDFGHKDVSGYSRQLDLNDAVASSTYTTGGKQYTRETFISHPDQVMVTRIRCNTGASVSFSAYYADILGGGGVTDGNDTLVANGHGDSDCGVAGAVHFSARTKLIPKGGTMTAANGRIQVSGADEVLILTTVRTNYVDSKTCNADEKGNAANDMKAVQNMTYDELYTRHIADYQELFHRVDVDLGGNSDVSNAKTTEQRIKEFSQTNDPKMVKLLFQYGRYLMISASRDAQAMNLQGIWNKYSFPAWGSKATTNINYEMNYWPAFTTNLAECFEPFVEKAKALQANGNETARVHYGILDGWVLHHNTDLWNRTAPIDGSWGQWPVGGAWISNMLYDAYRFNQDESYLTEIYPVISGSASFLNQLMVKQTVNGQEYAGISPSASPELPIPGYAWGDNVYCSFSVTMDNAICRELFKDVTEASTILGKDATLRGELQSKLTLLRPETIGKWGQIQEWAADLDNQNEKHRHISHLYGVFPGCEVNPETNSTTAKAAVTTLKGRGDAGTGWSEAWKLNCWARLGDAEHAYQLIRLLITPVDGSESGRLYANLWDAHPPFQIDGNFGFTSGVAEMLLQSQNDMIQLLPALPKAWNTGHANGLCARGNFEITEMNWTDGKLRNVTILSKSGGVCNLKYGSTQISFETEKGRSYSLNGALQFTDDTETLMNIALNQKVTASGAETGEAAENLTDGNAATKWCHVDGLGGEWAQVEFDAPANISRYTLHFAGDAEDIQFNARDFSLQASNDGQNWTDIDTVYGNTRTVYNKNVKPFSAQYVRLYLNTATQNNKGGARVYELELWGDTSVAKARSAFVTQQAEAYSFVSEAQIERKDDGTANLGFIKDGSYVVYRSLEFESGAKDFSVRAASNTEGGTIEIRVGSPTGKLLGSCEIPNTGGWQDYETFTCKLEEVRDVQDICLVFKGGSDYLLNVDSFVFTGIKGDANCDGQIDARDLTLAKRVMLTGDDTLLTPLGRSNADYDGNNNLNATDAKGIRDYLLGK
ncbi:MAG: glycoside hydrolase N-terminal domain-containing protein [Oscillospiraceae bacterium]|nr:glycoside hydrolase N-terminal domain-containing protein [Oscillospiraceae bacterium]